jgi:REP element-mobilizing transposase RayT
MLIEIPPKYAVSSVIGFLKGKSAIAMARSEESKEISKERTSGPEAMRFLSWVSKKKPFVPTSENRKAMSMRKKFYTPSNNRPALIQLT